MNKRLPTKQHLAWHEAEMGVLIHFDINVFEPEYRDGGNWKYVPPAEKFNPAQLDTDQWVKTAVDAGAKYAVLVVKHDTGFTLWPTKAYPYSVASSPWRGGEGDILKDFLKSCEKYDILPGIYYSASVNTYMNVVNPGIVRSGGIVAQYKYNRIIETMVDEIWCNYGEMFELWFDGGVLPSEMGGPRLKERLIKYQPNAVCFQGPEGFTSLIRWGGNEDGITPDPCWGWTDMCQPSGGQGQAPLYGAGKIDGEIWAAVESDMTIRDKKAFGGGWFWKAGEDHYVFSLEHLMDRYEKTVGRGTNLMLGMVIDDRGLVPDVDAARFKEFGISIKENWDNPISEYIPDSKTTAILSLPEKLIDRAIIMEDITNGQKIQQWTLEANIDNGKNILIAKGESLGHKRLVRFKPLIAKQLIFTINKNIENYESKIPAVIRKLVAFETINK